MKKLLTLAIAVLTTGAYAQKMDAFDYHVADIQVLQIKAVQKELGITEATRKKFNSYADDWRKEGQQLAQQAQSRGVDPSSDPSAQASFKALVETLKKRVLGTLSASQLKRTRELSLQVVGYRALLDPMVSKRLGLSTSEDAAVKSAFERGLKRNESLFGSKLDPIRKRYSAMKPKTREDADLLQAQANKEMKTAVDALKPQAEQLRKETESAMRKAVSRRAATEFEALKGKASSAVSSH